MTTQSKEVAKKPEKTIVDSVLARITEFQQLGELKVPQGYNPGNALKSAYLILLDTKTKDGKPVLEVCTRESIANALLNMVVQGLSPMKKQCDFIAYGNKLTLQREYHGTVALAKRYGHVVDVTGNVIYEKDEFQYEVDPTTGKKKVIKHGQTIDNIDLNKIKGAYATLIMEDGSTETEVMTFKQIQAAWNQGPNKGASPAHKNFPDQMCIKTVISRACKLKISTSDDTGLGEDEESVIDPAIRSSAQTIKEHANQEEIGFDEAEEVQETENRGAGEEQRPESDQKKTEVKGGPEPEPVSEGGKGHVKGPGF